MILPQNLRVYIQANDRHNHQDALRTPGSSLFNALSRNWNYWQTRKGQSNFEK